MAARNMSQDKQLRGVTMKDVLKKRQLDQALNVKEFAVLTGISYSTAREWFRLPGFPVLQRMVFWGDFVEWQRTRTATEKLEAKIDRRDNPRNGELNFTTHLQTSPRVARILSKAG